MINIRGRIQSARASQSRDVRDLAEAHEALRELTPDAT